MDNVNGTDCILRLPQNQNRFQVIFSRLLYLQKTSSLHQCLKTINKFALDYSIEEKNCKAEAGKGSEEGSYRKKTV